MSGSYKGAESLRPAWCLLLCLETHVVSDQDMCSSVSKHGGPRAWLVCKGSSGMAVLPVHPGPAGVGTSVSTTRIAVPSQQAESTWPVHAPSGSLGCGCAVLWVPGAGPARQRFLLLVSSCLALRLIDSQGHSHVSCLQAKSNANPISSLPRKMPHP